MRRALFAFLLLACASDMEGRPPVARITAQPRAIPEHDAFATDVILDGSESADPLDDPEGTLALSYRWRIEEDEARFVAGDDRTVGPTIRLAGERPARVELTVTDADGDSSTDVMQLQLTVEGGARRRPVPRSGRRPSSEAQPSEAEPGRRSETP